MLSMSNVSSGHVASGYYKAEGYYLENSPDAEKSAQFYGKGADETGLTDSFTDEKFVAVLDGQTPDGRTLGRWRDGEREHRPGIDLTFSAPKAVSIAALVGGDERIIKAHTDAVKTALDYVEANLIGTRRSVNGEMVSEQGGKIIAGLFQHDTSRALDPQLHTHAVVANMVKDSTGTFRSMSNEKMYLNKMLVGQIYRNALAEHLQDLGYQTKQLDKGLFDIVGVPENLSDNFSKRRQEIVAALKEKDYEPTATASSLAALATRSQKKPIQRHELQAAWQAEVKALDIDLQRVLEVASQGTAPSRDLRDATAKEAVDFAVAHHSERQSTYQHKEILTTALKFRPGVSHTSAEREIATLLNAGTLHNVNGHRDVTYTDAKNIRLELENNHLVRSTTLHETVDLRSATERLTRRTSDGIIARKLDRTTLTDGQKDGAAMVLSSASYVTGVQGYAGTGKTYMMSTAIRLAEARGYTIEGLAPSHKAVTALNEALPVAATVESALVRHENGANFGDKSKTILAVDEASMLSSENMNRVLKMATDQGYSKVALIGDIKQLDAVGAGSAFRALQDAGMPTALMADIQRQRTDEGRATVLKAISGEIKEAMAGVNKLTEVKAKDAEETRSVIASRLAQTYTAIPGADRSSTALIVLTNAMRHAVNAEIQDNLRLSGDLAGPQANLDTLTPRNFTQAEAREIGSYRTGDIVMAPVVNSGSDLQANTLYTVSGIKPDDRRLTLTAPDGETVSLELSATGKATPNLAVYEADKQTFITGDRVKFKITDREHGIFNSAEGTLRNLGRASVHIETDTGERLTIPTSSLAAKGMQLAYAATAHDYQGSDADRVILGMVSTEHLSTQKSFYVGLSRMRDTIHLVTDDVAKLTDRITSETGERMNALEALAQDRDLGKSDLEKRTSEQDKTERKDREITPDDGDLKSRIKEADRDPENNDQNQASKDNQKTDQSDEKSSAMDRLLDELNIDQKQRDERSR